MGARCLRTPLVGAGGRADRRSLGIVLRPARPHRRVDELHRPHRADRSRGRGERAHRLAGARGPAVLLRNVGDAARRDPTTAFPARRNGARRAGHHISRRCVGPGGHRARRFRIRFRSRAARCVEGAARVEDARHRDDDPGRAGRDHPAAAHRRRRDRGRPGGRGRPRLRCTASPTCSTPTASGWPAAVCWSWAPAPGSSPTSGACSPRWASRRWCSPRLAGWRTGSSRPPSIGTHTWPARRVGWRCWTSCAALSPTGSSCPGRRSRSSSTTSSSRSTGRRRQKPGGAPGDRSAAQRGPGDVPRHARQPARPTGPRPPP